MSWYYGHSCTLAAADDAPCERFQRQMPHVIVPLLDLGNLVDMLHAQSASDRSAGFPCLARARFDTSCLPKQVRGWRGLGDECERAIGLNRDQYWRRRPRRQVGGTSCRTTGKVRFVEDPRTRGLQLTIELFAEVHRLHTSCA